MLTTIAQIKRANADAGFNFFSQDTMAFFRSTVEDRPVLAVREHEASYFITSEVNPSGLKAWSVRAIDWNDGRIHTVGAFHSYLNRHEAVRAAEIAAQYVKRPF